MLRHARWRLARVVALLSVSVIVVRAALPPYDCAAAILVGWAPLLYVVHRQSPRHAFATGATHGLLLGLLGHEWIVSVLWRKSAVAPPAAVLALLVIASALALRVGLVAWLVAWTSSRGVPLRWSFPLFCCAAEVALPGVFPWTNALGVSSAPLWQQLAEVGGTVAVSGWICLVNALLTEACVMSLRGDRPRMESLRRAADAVAVVAAVSLAGVVLQARQEERASHAPRLRVGLAHSASADRTAPDDVTALRSLALSSQSREGAVDLWVWPETTLQSPRTEAELSRGSREYLRSSHGTGDLTGELLVGAVVHEHGILENRAVLFGSDHVVKGSYSKRLLMPLGETLEVGWGISLPRSTFSALTPFHPGTDALPLRVGEHELAVSICYEDIVAELVRSSVASDTGLLVNLTSDEWFVDSPGAAYHFALARLRAVEQRRYFVRATRDGISGVVASTGRAIETMSGERSRISIVDVPLLQGQTIYARIGGWVGPIVQLLSLAVLLVASRAAPTRELRA